MCGPGYPFVSLTDGPLAEGEKGFRVEIVSLNYAGSASIPPECVRAVWGSRQDRLRPCKVNKNDENSLISCKYTVVRAPQPESQRVAQPLPS